MFNDYSKLSNEPGDSMYAVTSWCRMPFYEANFGKGCPVWVVGNVAPRLELVTMLLDSNDFKGIEAWVTLSEEDMLSFEQNPELLAFASPNPAVIF
ncbi:BnaAnng26960D [Brassica napus]|uniref:BnaAnng26960D protein n=4 Tax=Brassica TaxID=3705 RepID=A0A078JPH3_BRANA|nr:BnaAnng26960D [Brassica napus]